MTEKQDHGQQGNTQVRAVCQVENSGAPSTLDDCIKDGKLGLKNGSWVPCLTAVASGDSHMPVTEGKVGNSVVETLRDTGCGAVVVKQQFVKPEQYTGAVSAIRMIDNTIRRLPMAKISIDTPFFKGEADAICIPDAHENSPVTRFYCNNLVASNAGVSISNSSRNSGRHF